LSASIVKPWETIGAVKSLWQRNVRPVVTMTTSDERAMASTGSGHPVPPRGLRAAVRNLDLSYFALVMATGIVSTGLHAHGLRALAVGLTWVAGIAYGVLVIANGARITLFGREFRTNLADPARGFGAFTFVAATNVLGTQLAADAHHVAAVVLLVVGMSAWLILGYLVPWMAVLSHFERTVLAEANGTWFVWVVASQSIAVLVATLQPQLGSGRAELALLAVFCWSVGVFLYIVAGILVAGRMLVHPLGPADLTPPYWIGMGATAITVFAGARIVQMADAPAMAATGGLIAGVSVLFWSFGTWLIPPLIAAGVWRHVIRRVPLTYTPALWSIVFPLGMYGVAGHYLGQADQLPIVALIGDLEIWVAFAAWALTFTGMLSSCLPGKPREARFIRT
jgi:tellurite resistance protein TehA-like permease